MLVFAKYLVSISSSNYMPPDNRKRKQTFFPEVFLKISQNSQENACARVSFLIELQTSRSFQPNFEQVYTTWEQNKEK